MTQIIALLAGICLVPATSDAQPAPIPTLAHARQQWMRGAYGEALEAFRALAADEQHKGEATRGAAECQMQIGQYEQAIDALQQLDAEQNADTHLLLARLYAKLGKYDDVLRHARRAMALRSDLAGARLVLGQTLDRLGRRDQAVENDRWFEEQVVARAELPRDAEWITDVAVGFVRYSVWTGTNVPDRTRHALHEMLQRVYERLDRTYWPARIAAADLLRERYNNDPDHGSLSDYLAALRINENLPQAHVGIGEVALSEWNFEEAERRARRALETNPRFAPALHLLARKSMLERRYEQAIEACAKALEINANDLVALSITAAAGACRSDENLVRRMSERVEAVNPRCALLHRTLGDALGGIRQYEASERAYRKAIELDPTDANARTELGMMYMQWGHEHLAREALEAAWALDPFNQRTQFTLELLETLEQFARVETEHFIVKLDAAADNGIGEFIAEYLEEIREAVTADFDTQLTEKTIIEVFPTRRAFGVRITGKPWIHTVGACTGRVIALASPRDAATSSRYDLARVLKHEFTHTVTLAATENRIPHWLTEGLAVLQEDAPRPFDWWQLLSEAVRRGRLFSLESIDWGFIRPQRPTDRTMAYAQSEWMCEYIIERFGYDAIGRMLGAYRKGKPQDAVFLDVLGTAPASFDRDFQAWARKQLLRLGFDVTPPEDATSLAGRVERQPQDAALRGRLARALLDEGEYERSLQAARRALDLDADQPEALRALVAILAERIRRERDDGAVRRYEDQAAPALQRLAEVDPQSWTAAKMRGRIALRRNRCHEALQHFQQLKRLCPMDPESWRALSAIHLRNADHGQALTNLRTLAQLGQTDPDVPATIARILRRRRDLHEARYWTRRALFLDPFNLSLRETLADTHMLAADAASALKEYTLLTRMDHQNAGYWEKAAFAAHKLGRPDQARRFAHQAVERDPDSPARSLLSSSPEKND